ncbi:MAG: transposase, partial [Methylocystis sp.]|nr:transposase [Methylocystis sp.]
MRQFRLRRHAPPPEGQLCQGRDVLISVGTARDGFGDVAQELCATFVCRCSFVGACSKGGGFLGGVLKTFGWSAFAFLRSNINGKTRGAPGYPPLVMFKIVHSQQWRTLSAPGAEAAARDRLSFRRLRRTIDGLDPSQKLLAEANRRLDAHVLIARQGAPVGATISSRRLHEEERQARFRGT